MSGALLVMVSVMMVLTRAIPEHLLFMEAFHGGASDVAAFLKLDPTFDINGIWPGTFGRPVLIEAVVRGDNKAVEGILSLQGIDVNRRDYGNNTALHWAASEASFEVFAALVANNAVDVNAQDAYGNGALHVVIHVVNIKALKLLLSRPDLDINLIGRYQMSSLMCAVTRDDDPEILRVLLDDERLRPALAISALKYAQANGKIEKAAVLSRFVKPYKEIGDLRAANTLLERAAKSHSDDMQKLLDTKMKLAQVELDLVSVKTTMAKENNRLREELDAKKDLMEQRDILQNQINDLVNSSAVIMKQKSDLVLKEADLKVVEINQKQMNESQREMEVKLAQVGLELVLLKKTNATKTADLMQMKVELEKEKMVHGLALESSMGELGDKDQVIEQLIAKITNVETASIGLISGIGVLSVGLIITIVIMRRQLKMKTELGGSLRTIIHHK